MKTAILFFIIFTNFSLAWGQEKFLAACKEPSEIGYVYSEEKETMNALKFFFKTRDCAVIAKKLSTITSFNEFIPPSSYSANKAQTLLFPWTDDFPYLYGLNDVYSYPITIQNLTGPDVFSTRNMYQDLDIFAEFKNITAINLLYDYNYLSKDNYSSPFDVCEFIAKFPHIKTITIDVNFILNAHYDECLAASKIDGVIIRKPFSGFKGKLPKTKIIGIEYYTGDLNHLGKYRYLRYLGISNETKAVGGIEALALLTNLTHFTMNIKSIKNLTDISNLKNLSYLNLTCIDNEKGSNPTDQSCKSGFSLSQIDFLRSLRWLEHLNLSFTNIKDIGDLSHLKKLSYLKLRGNNIANISNISKLSKLTYLDLSGNQVEDIKSISRISELKFFNLSGNQIRNLSPLKDLTKLEFLNLSNNSSAAIDGPIFPQSLRALNLNGGGGSSVLSNAGLDRYKGTLPINSSKEHALEIETLFHDFNSKTAINTQNNCSVSPQLNELPDLSHLAQLEVLTLKNNQLGKMPNVKYLSKLKYLNLARNEMSDFSEDLIPENLEFLDFSVNKLQAFPTLSTLTKLIRMEVSLNNIEDLNNVKYLPRSIVKVGLEDNLITDLDVLLRNPTQQLPYVNSYETAGNPVQKNSFVGSALLPQGPVSMEKHNLKKCPEARF